MESVNWIPVRWTVEGLDASQDRDRIDIRRIGQLDGPDRYKVSNLFGYCLNRRAILRYEPLPSARTDAFYKACRFDTFEEARAIAEKYLRRQERNEKQRKRVG